MILVIDNHDSFTYSLAQYIKELHQGKILVIGIDLITLVKIKYMRLDAIVLSPGPGRPSLKLINIVKRFNSIVPILGVCLGHQAIGQAFGAKLAPVPKIMHGSATSAFHTSRSIFKNIPSPMQVGLYNSLVIKKNTLPYVLECLATSEQQIIMGIKHKEALTFGVQFHPESLLTQGGKQLIANFLTLINTAK